MSYSTGLRSSGIRTVCKVACAPGRRRSCHCTRCLLPSRPLTRSGADGTTCLESLLKEISVIVSMVWQAMTLLRSQHLGLGRGGFWCLSDKQVRKNIQEGTLHCGGLGWSRLPRSAQTLFNACATLPRVDGNRDKTRGATGSMSMV